MARCSAVYRRFTKAAERAELPRLRCTICATIGTQAIRVFKVHEVQRLIGHRHITTTERYLHYTPDPDAPRVSGPVAAINFKHGQDTQQNVGWQVLCREGGFRRGRAGWTLATPDTIPSGCACRTRSTDWTSYRRRYEGSDGHAGR